MVWTIPEVSEPLEGGAADSVAGVATIIANITRVTKLVASVLLCVIDFKPH